MTRDEEIVNAAKEQEKCCEFGDLVQSSKSRGVNSAYGIGFIEGAEWADEHPINYDGKAYLYVGNKCAELTKKDLINKACKWLEENLLNYWSQINANDTDDFIEIFKKVMGE